MILTGIIPMLPTPFDETGQILWEDFAPVISYQLDNGVRGIAALGLGGEASRLSDSERRAVAEKVLSFVPKDIPVIIGVSANDTTTACALASHAAANCATAVMVAPPNMPGISREKLRDHYLAVCDAAAPIDVMVQDAPAFLDVSLGAAFVAELAAERINVRYAKSEASPAAERTAELAQLLGKGVGVFGGASGLHCIDVLEAGAIGLIPGCEAPAQFVGIFEAFASGRAEEAAQCFAQLQPLLVFETQALDLFIASSKAILKARGLIRSDALRGPNPLGQRSRQLLARHAQRAIQCLTATARLDPAMEGASGP
jgi:4-hydroxy-tetrahydrodipicolinate synthase